MPIYTPRPLYQPAEELSGALWSGKYTCTAVETSLQRCKAFDPGSPGGDSSETKSRVRYWKLHTHKATNKERVYYDKRGLPTALALVKEKENYDDDNYGTAGKTIYTDSPVELLLRIKLIES